MIGLSLSLCIRDIALGRVEQKQVEEIFARTRFTTDREFEIVVRRYRATVWREFPAQAERIARELRVEGKIRQPRVSGRVIQQVVPGKHWVASKDQIVWVTQTGEEMLEN